MVLTKDKTQSTDPKARINPTTTKAIVVTVVPTIHLKSVLLMARPAILVIKKAISNHFVDPGREARAREDGNQGNPDMINMRLQVQMTEPKMTTPVGFSMNKTQYRFFSVEVFVQTLILRQTFSWMKLMVEEFSVCLLT